MSIYDERLARIKAAIALEPVDKIPLISGAAAVTSQFCGVKMSDFISDMELNCTVNIKATDMMGNIDGIQTPLSTPDGLPTIWLSNIKAPGRELSDNELWQVDEEELIQESDYDEILENGFADWYARFMKEKLNDPIGKLTKYGVGSYNPTAIKRFEEAGYVVVKDGSLLTPFEMLCGGRSLVTFLTEDLMEIPEKMDEVFAVIHKFNMDRYEKRFANPETRPFGVWVGGWRGTPETLSPAMFEHFSWKYFLDLINLCLDYNVVPFMHLDACWNLGLHYFHDYVPAGRAVMCLDGKTDIHLAKEVCGDKICIMGDVPATMLAFGKAQEVYDYVSMLCREIGPTGYMCCSGCDIPFNAILENVQMMSKAVDDAPVK